LWRSLEDFDGRDRKSALAETAISYFAERCVEA
jgi:hypothetical protein